MRGHPGPGISNGQLLSRARAVSASGRDTVQLWWLGRESEETVDLLTCTVPSALT